ncbi:MAG: response regulator [Candidatus Margulisbacteria bacterium]|nr:response regulator [Candidatus Margulisiibacteriota bacterium]
MKTQKIYIIDDSEYIALMLKKVLFDLDYVTLGISTKEDHALDNVRRLKDEIDIITLDIYMGKTDGMSLIPKLLAINPKFKIVMVSSNRDEKTIIKCIQMGAKHYILKPFHMEDIRKIIQKISQAP